MSAFPIFRCATSKDAIARMKFFLRCRKKKKKKVPRKKKKKAGKFSLLNRPPTMREFARSHLRQLWSFDSAYAMVIGVKTASTRTESKAAGPLEAFDAVVSELRDGPRSLGDLRRSLGMQPQMLALLNRDNLGAFKFGQDKAGHPTIGLRQNTETDLKLFEIMRSARPTGITLNRIWSRHRIKSEVTENWVARNSDLLQIIERQDQQGRQRRFVTLRSSIQQPIPVATLAQGALLPAGEGHDSEKQPESLINDAEPKTEAPKPFELRYNDESAPKSAIANFTPDELLEISLAEGRLFELVETYARHSTQLENYGLTEKMIKRICEVHPGKYLIEPRGNPVLREFAVSLAPPLKEITSTPAEPAAPQEPIALIADLLTPEQEKEMRWAGGRRYRPQPSSVSPNQINRKRFPMVKL